MASLLGSKYPSGRAGYARPFPGPDSIVTLSPEGLLDIRLRRLLKNSNAGGRSPHWSKRNRSRKNWQAVIATALVGDLTFRTAQALLLPGALHGAYGTRPTVKRTLTITRLVKYRHHFIRDTFDNLPWATKELRDALVGLGLIADDSPEWCDTTITQDVSPDGQPWTHLQIAPVVVPVRPVGAPSRGARL